MRLVRRVNALSFMKAEKSKNGLRGMTVHS